MTMDKTEIVTNYRQAADKKAQLGILADLNLCSRAEIADILLEAGEAVDGRWIGRPRTKRREQAQEVEPEKETPAAVVALTVSEARSLAEFLESALFEHLRADKGVDNLEYVHNLTGLWLRCREAVEG